MTREIKFRGKMKDNQEWVFGYYFDGYILNYIDAASTWYSFIDKSNDGPSDHNVTSRAYEVIPETVGQYTGIKDSKGVDIFVGDVVKANGSMDFSNPLVTSESIREIYFHISGFTGVIPNNEFDKEYPSSASNWNNYTLWNTHSDLEIISNIHDNPSLLSQQ